MGVWIETKTNVYVNVWYNCHTLRGCVDWNVSAAVFTACAIVTPCVGVWIETNEENEQRPNHSSHPAWVCGLKLGTVYHPSAPHRHTLRGCVDWNLWLTCLYCRGNRHTLRGCVDWNLQLPTMPRRETCHTLRGCVDWNPIGITVDRCGCRSHPAWVCGLKLSKFWTAYTWKCHTLRGCVDWNLVIAALPVLVLVTPCVGVWIETERAPWAYKLARSHPAWVCGLKLYLF